MDMDIPTSDTTILVRDLLMLMLISYQDSGVRSCPALPWLCCIWICSIAMVGQ